MATDHPKLSDMLEFIERKCQTLQTVNVQSPSVASNVTPQSFNFRKTTNHIATHVVPCSSMWSKLFHSDLFSLIDDVGRGEVC